MLRARGPAAQGGIAELRGARVGRHLKCLCQSPLSLPEAPSNPALGTSRDGAFAAPLGRRTNGRQAAQTLNLTYNKRGVSGTKVLRERRKMEHPVTREEGGGTKSPRTLSRQLGYLWRPQEAEPEAL